MEKGRYVARLLEHQIGFNENTKNKFVAGCFQCVGGRFGGEAVSLMKSLTPKTRDAIRKMFFACGWDGKTPTSKSKLDRLVMIDVLETEYEGASGRTVKGFEVGFVNPLTSVKVQASEKEEAEFLADLIGSEEYDEETGEVYEGASSYGGASS